MNNNDISQDDYKQNQKPKYVSGCYKLDVFDWMQYIPACGNQTNIVEVRFKNTRKEYFENVNRLPLKVGDVVAVEGAPGHDIGVVSLTGDMVLLQLKKNNIPRPKDGFKKIYRDARPSDIEKWEEAKSLEHLTMIKARQISKDLNLDMKIGDVEYQGDKTKAIFYYIAEERVDFRELIKVLAEKFKIRIEMRQIGARQEAGRIGGIGSCGKELCCSSFIGKFVSVTTNSARHQELSLNPQKLAGQCGKLKCCLNFEVDSYIDAQKDFPSTTIPLQYKGGKANHSKTDVYKRMMWYSCYTDSGVQFVGLSVDRVKEIIALNKDGVIPDNLVDEKTIVPVVKELDYDNVVGQESLTRFDNPPQQKKRNNKRKPKNKQNSSIQNDVVGKTVAGNTPKDSNNKTQLNVEPEKKQIDDNKQETKVNTQKNYNKSKRFRQQKPKNNTANNKSDNNTNNNENNSIEAKNKNNNRPNNRKNNSNRRKGNNNGDKKQEPSN